MKRTLSIFALVVALVVIGHPMSASAQDMYQVKITNLTPGQTFTPFVLVTHSADMNVFLPGTMASPALEALAENGMTNMLVSMYSGMSMAGNSMTTPGVTTEFMVSGMPGYRLSLVSMLIPTNDTFVGANMMLPMEGGMVGYAYAYDAGTETNDEMCASIPGPSFEECGGPGMGGDAGMGEGAIVISNGINGQGDFMPMMRDWKNPVARITITKM